MSIRDIVTGKGMERMSSIAFRLMSLTFRIRDMLRPPGKKLSRFNIKKGETVIDYGCGPGGYIKAASGLVGEKGMVYGADIHELAVKSVEKLIKKNELTNAEVSLIKSYICSIEDNSADLIYALDMFHMVKEPSLFLKELHRLIKKDGRLILEDGHQPRGEARAKVENSGLWEIRSENKEWMECRPL